MNKKLNSVPSAETKDEVSAIVDVTTSSPNNAKPNVVCSSLSDPLKQVLNSLNNLTINDAREVLNQASIAITKYTKSKTESIVFVN